MIKKFWTSTQKEEIEKCCSEYEIPGIFRQTGKGVCYLFHENSRRVKKMIKKFWTSTQKEEIEKCCSEYEIPQDITSEMFRIIHILDENYGVDRALKTVGE